MTPSRTRGSRARSRPIFNEPVVVEGAEIATDSDILRAEVEIDAQGFQDAAADLIADGVIAEQAQVPRSAAGCDSGKDGNTQPQDSAHTQCVEIGGARRLQFGQVSRLEGEPAQAIGDEQNDFGIILSHQAACQIVQVVHALFFDKRELKDLTDRAGFVEKSGSQSVLFVGSEILL